MNIHIYKVFIFNMYKPDKQAVGKHIVWALA